MPNKTVRQPKIANLMAFVRQALDTDYFRFSAHANERMVERGITIPEVIYILRNGRYEKSKDSYEALHNDWNYSVKGQTLDGRQLRIVVALEPTTKVLVVTVIKLGH